MYLLPLSLTDTIAFNRNGLDALENVLEEWDSDLSGIQVNRAWIISANF